MKEKTCCFSGHRKLPQNKIESIVKRLNDEIDNLYHQGVTAFISGGALGFDQVAASLVIAKMEMGFKIRLVFALPCKNQNKLWKDEQNRLYYNLLAEANEIIYVSKEYSDSCMKKRNQYMVNRSAYCICALLYSISNTNQTVKYARKKGLRIINVVD
ncbi:MAG: SLOG family protein [Heliobacteriaceae bacterium]|nr:SLOG family protein [Heliobacteriaceae bacterium]